MMSNTRAIHRKGLITPEPQAWLENLPSLARCCHAFLRGRGRRNRVRREPIPARSSSFNLW